MITEYAAFTGPWLKLEHYRLDLTMTKRPHLATRTAASRRMLELLFASCVLLLGACAGKDDDKPRGGGPPAVVTTMLLAPGPWNDRHDARFKVGP